MNDWLKSVDSSTVLLGQTIMYTAYCLVIISVIAWIATRLTKKPGDRSIISPKLFYGWVGLLVVIGVSLHLTTYNTIPWVKPDLEHPDADVVATYNIAIGDHKWDTSTGQMTPPCNQLVEFKVTSTDLTYGFGIFRPDSTMVAQMQVVPGHENNLYWTFTKNGTYHIVSTEYSGPLGYDPNTGMNIAWPDAIVVSDCQK